MRLHPRTSLCGALLATALAAAAGWFFATSGSRSPEAEAKPSKTADNDDRLTTSATTAPAMRALKGRTLKDFMMCSESMNMHGG